MTHRLFYFVASMCLISSISLARVAEKEIEQESYFSKIGTGFASMALGVAYRAWVGAGTGALASFGISNAFFGDPAYAKQDSVVMRKLRSSGSAVQMSILCGKILISLGAAAGGVSYLIY